MPADAESKYVDVRRRLIFVEDSIDKATQWVVFEPNDDRTGPCRTASGILRFTSG